MYIFKNSKLTSIQIIASNHRLQVIQGNTSKTFWYVVLQAFKLVPRITDFRYIIMNWKVILQRTFVMFMRSLCMPTTFPFCSKCFVNLMHCSILQAQDINIILLPLLKAHPYSPPKSYPAYHYPHPYFNFNS